MKRFDRKILMLTVSIAANCSFFVVIYMLKGRGSIAVRAHVSCAEGLGFESDSRT